MRHNRPRLPVILLGAGGHAGVVLDLLRLARRRVIGVVAPEQVSLGTVPWLGSDAALNDRDPDTFELANGVGSIRPGSARIAVFDDYRRRGYRFATLIHPSATVAQGVTMGMGTLICAGVVVQAGAAIGDNVILNTRCVVDHDCRIDSGVHVSPGAVLCGDVVVGVDSHVGAGAIIIQGISIGAGALVAAGAVVVRNVPAGSVVVGIPARLKP